jgi:putative membrane protein
MQGGSGGAGGYTGTYPGPYGGYGAPPRPRRHRLWIVGAVVIAVVAVVGVLLLLYVNGFFGPTPYGGHPYFGFFGGFLLLFIIVWLAFFLLRVSFWGARTQGRYGGYGGPRRGPDPAVVIARQRYARGEITREQYDQIMTDLGRRGRGPGGPYSGS